MKLSALSFFPRILVLCLVLCFGLSATAQTQYKITLYDEFDGVSQRRVTDVDQTRDGYIWLSTWNGLDRYDGYEFVNFKSCAQDEDPLPSNRIRHIRRDSLDNLICYLEDQTFLFDCKTYKFRKVNVDTIGLIRDASTPKVDVVAVGLPEIPGKRLIPRLTDNSGNVWVSSKNGLYKLTPLVRHNKQDLYDGNASVRAFMRDQKGRLWISCQEDKMIMVVDPADGSKKYLAPSGKITPAKQSFGVSAYTLCQSADGSVWIGSKPESLVKLTPMGDDQYAVEHIENQANVHDIIEDSRGRIWVASYEEGLSCITQGIDGKLRVARASDQLKNYPIDQAPRLRHILITPQGEMLLSSTAGLIVADINKQSLEDIEFKLHQANLKRPTALSNNSVMYSFRDSKGQIYVCTESGGVNLITSADLLADSLDFKHFNKKSGLQSDIALSMLEHDGCLWVVSHSGIIKMDDATSSRFDMRYFNDSDTRFSEAAPIALGGGDFAFGLEQGLAILNLDSIGQNDFVPAIAVTSVCVQGDDGHVVYNNTDTISLEPSERSITLNFAAFDYKEPHNIEYAFSFDGSPWNYIGANHSATFLNLRPGTHRFSVKSTNSHGVWVDNARTYVIEVVPTIWETTFMRVVYVILIALAIAAIAYTIVYIHRIRKRKETLEAYLSLIKLNQEQPDDEKTEDEAKALLEQAQVKAADDSFIKRVVAFVTEHMDDSEINLDDMAQAAATSKAGLNRKMKLILGITPYAFVREVRLQEAARQLTATSKPISEIALACGFADQRYFSKIFKQKYNLSPTEYRAQ